MAQNAAGAVCSKAVQWSLWSGLCPPPGFAEIKQCSVWRKGPGFCSDVSRPLHRASGCLWPPTLRVQWMGDSVHVLGFDRSEEDFRAGFAPGISSRLTFHDGFHDPLDWNGKADLTTESFSSQQVLARVLGSPSAGASVSVIVDSLSWVLLHSSATLVMQALHQLQREAVSAGSKLRQVIALVHQDLHEPGTVASACHVASTVVTLMPCPSSTSPACESEALATATVRHHKKSGKVIKKDLSFAVLEGFTLKTGHPSKPQPAVTEDSDPRVDPAANLTFNLNLSDTERQAKENLSLPYLFSAEKKSSLLQSRVSGGKIYYEPEAVDDVDDEDPDDDLDV